MCGSKLRSSLQRKSKCVKGVGDYSVIEVSAIVFEWVEAGFT